MESIIDREKRLKKIALDLLERCKGEDLTFCEFNRILELLQAIAANQTKI